MSAPTLEAVDVELISWRERLAAASRNVSELSELPEFAIARLAASGAGRTAEEARTLVATMDELWQGVLLIGSTLDRAEQVRRGGSRLWRGEEAAQQAMEILRGPSIVVDLSDTPVLHRRLLAGARATATVDPATLLQTMDAAFDRARERLGRIAEASSRATSLRDRLAGTISRLPTPGPFNEALAAADLPDALDRLDALEALSPRVDAAAVAANLARTGLDRARIALARLQSLMASALTDADACRAQVSTTFPVLDEAAFRELGAWLDRIARTLENGRTEPCLVGLANWQALHDRLTAEAQSLAATTGMVRARFDELRARLGALQAKHRARPSPASDRAASQAVATLGACPMDLASAARDLAAYEATLAARS